LNFNLLEHSRTLVAVLKDAVLQIFFYFFFFFFLERRSATTPAQQRNARTRVGIGEKKKTDSNQWWESAASVLPHHFSAMTSVHLLSHNLKNLRMGYKRSYKRKAKRSMRYGKKRSYKTAKVSPKIKTYVKRELARNVENKLKDTEIGPKNVNNTITDTTVVNLLPQIQQGTTQSTRIGNKIKIKNFWLRLSITLSPIAGIIANPLPTYIDVYLFKTKYQNNWDGALSSTDMTEFLQNDSSASSYTGAVLDGLRQVNTDLFKCCIHKRITLFNPNTSVATYGATSSINPNRCLYWNITKFVKKNWLFEDSVATCTNDNLYCVVASTQSDGASTGASTTATYYAMTQITYEDA